MVEVVLVCPVLPGTEIGRVTHRRQKRVLILAGDTDANIGDRAIVYSTCAELRRLAPNVRITLVSGDPDSDRSYFQAETIPRGLRGLPRLAKAAASSDLVLCGGGGLFQDDASLVKMPYWAVRLAFVRCLARRIFGYSLGVGPLDWPLSRVAARVAFACMEEVSVRDDLARATTEQLTSRPVHRIPDPALCLPPAPVKEAARLLEEVGAPTNGTPIVGVALRRWFHQHPTLIPHKYAVKYGLRRVRGQEDCQAMVGLIAKLLDHVVEDHGAHILFLPTYNVSHEADDRICHEVAGRMKSERHALLRIADPRLYKAVVGRLTALLSSRMHPTIFAAAMGIPAVGLSYNQKFQGFFQLIGCPDRVTAIDDFVRRGMVDELRSMLGDAIGTDTGVLPRVTELMEDTRRFTHRILDRSHSRGRES
jgi:polysaccharide pyruvyl transferase WcaK-like protein